MAQHNSPAGILPEGYFRTFQDELFNQFLRFSIHSAQSLIDNFIHSVFYAQHIIGLQFALL